MFEGEVAHKLLERLRLARWLRRFPPRLVWAAFVFINGFLAVGILAALAVVSHAPLVFPSVGPTAFLLYFMPTAPTASPRNTLCGHALGIGCGYAALCLLGLEHAPSAILEEIHWRRVLAAALSLAATGALMILFRVVHPPAGATTLIISLGFITTPAHLGVIEIAVALLALQALAVNRLAGIDYPLWSKRVPPPGPDTLAASPPPGPTTAGSAPGSTRGQDAGSQP
jgi:CBS-domain-containing membrane protein